MESANLVNNSNFRPGVYHMIMDSGATTHITCDANLLTDIHSITPGQIVTAGGHIHNFNKAGTLIISETLSLKNVKLVPALGFTILSVPQCTSAGYEWNFAANRAYLLKPPPANARYNREQLIIFTAKRIGNLYVHVFDNAVDPDASGNGMEYQNPSSSQRKPSMPKKPQFSPSTVARDELNQARAKNQQGSKTASAKTSASPSPILSAFDGNESSQCCDNPEHFIGIVIDAPLLHSRLGHIGQTQLKPTIEHYNLKVNDQPTQSTTQDPSLADNPNCTTCVDSKARRASIGRTTAVQTRPPTGPMDVIHCDLIGPISEFIDSQKVRITAFDGCNYLLVCVDGFTKFVTVIPLVDKSQTTEKLIQLIKFRENATRLKLIRLHTDGGGEFINSQLKKFLLDNGTELTTSAPYTPELNGVAERMNRTLTEMARSMLNHANAPTQLWSYAYVHAALIYNRCCQPSNGGSVPAKLMRPSDIIDLDKLKVWGCNAYVLIEEGKRGKLQRRTQNAAYVGYSEQFNAFKVILVDDPSFIKISRNVQFDENSFSFMSLIMCSIKEITGEQNDEAVDRVPPEYC